MSNALLDFCRNLVQTGHLVVRFPDGSVDAFGNTSEPTVSIEISTDRAARAIARDPALAFGESYMRGELAVDDGKLLDLIALLMQNESCLKNGPLPIRARMWARFAFRRLMQMNWRSRARQQALHHYDVEVEFFDLFLDAERQYSCALYADDDDLEAAQLRKLRHIRRKLLLRPDVNVLDIGCGWGGLAISIARTPNVQVTGITLSPSQLASARQRAWREYLADRVEFALLDYRDVQRRYDRIVSVGMLEHVGVGNYAKFFRTIRRCLTDNGVALVHSIGRSDGPGYTNAFIQKHIFPGGYVPALSELMPAIEKSGLIVTDIEVLRLHYAKTLAAWRFRLRRHWAEAVALKGEEFCRMWEFYLAGSEAAFREQKLVVFQIQLSRDIENVPLTRDYLGNTEGALRAECNDARRAH